MKRLLILLALAGATGGLAFQGSGAVATPVLTYGIDVPFAGNGPFYGGLCIASVSGSPRLRLTPPGFARDPAWSPDGSSVAYARNEDLFVARVGGTSERNLTPGSLNGSEPTWSPDGRRLAFTSRGSQGSRVGVVDRSGSNLRFLNLSVPGNQSHPAWAPNGLELALISRTLIPPIGTLSVVEVDGARSRLVANGAAEPTWSPDGSRLAYVSAAGGLVVVNADGTNARTIALGAASPAWSPDGRLIAFVRAGALYVIRPDGAGERAVLPGSLPVHGPAWRPAAARYPAPSRPCILSGGSRPDVIRGTTAAEIILSGPGSDTVFAGGGDDIVIGGSGNDFLSGEAGNDQLAGAQGRDRLYGGRGDDVLYGRDSEPDLLDGGRGRDAATEDDGQLGNARDRTRSIP